MLSADNNNLISMCTTKEIENMMIFTHFLIILHISRYFTVSCLENISSLAWDNQTRSVKRILLSGGIGAESSVEIFDPDTGHSCFLPSLPEDNKRYGHTMDNNVICGGDDYLVAKTTCLTFSSGNWESTPLLEERSGHCSWEIEEGTLVMGGASSPATSEIVGREEQSFLLQYNTWYM